MNDYKILTGSVRDLDVKAVSTVAPNIKTNTAVKADNGKPPMGLLPWPALWDVAKVLNYGKIKYAEHNWKKGMKWSRMYDAALRHLSAFIENEDLDPESSLPHLAHCACCILFLATYQILGIGIDDRYKPEKKE
jgi:hypothetical protein